MLILSRLVGPLLGGVIFARVGYNTVFALSMALIALDIILRILVIETKSAKRWRPDTVPDVSIIESAETVVPWKTSVFFGQGSDDPEAVLMKSESTRITVMPVDLLDDAVKIHSTKATTPDVKKTSPRRLPTTLTLLTSRRLLSALWGTMVLGAIITSLDTVLTLQTSAVFHWDSLGGGLIFLPITIPALIGPVVGYLCDRYGPRWPTFVGFFGLCPVMTLMRLIDRDTLGHKVLICVLLTIAGMCFTFILDPLMAEIGYVVGRKARTDPERYGDPTKVYGQAFSLFTMAWAVGNIIGPLIAGLIRDKAGWGILGLVLGMWSGVTAIPTGLWCGGWLWDADQRWDKNSEGVIVGVERHRVGSICEGTRGAMQSRM